MHAHASVNVYLTCTCTCTQIPRFAFSHRQINLAGAYMWEMERGRPKEGKRESEREKERERKRDGTKESARGVVEAGEGEGVGA